MKLQPAFVLLVVLGCGACAATEAPHQEHPVHSVEEWVHPDSEEWLHSADSLRDLLTVMTDRLNRGEHEAALIAWKEREGMVVWGMGVPHLASLAEACNSRKEDAEILADFEAQLSDRESADRALRSRGIILQINGFSGMGISPTKPGRDLFSPIDCACPTCELIPSVQ